MGDINEHSFIDGNCEHSCATPPQGRDTTEVSAGQLNAVLTHSGVCLPSLHAAIPTTAWDGAALLPKRAQAESQDPQNSCLILFLTPKSSATYTVPLASPVLHVNVSGRGSPASELCGLVLISFKQRPQVSSRSPVGHSTSASPERSVLAAAGADMICIQRWLAEVTALLILQWLSVTMFSHPQDVGNPD